MAKQLIDFYKYNIAPVFPGYYLPLHVNDKDENNLRAHKHESHFFYSIKKIVEESIDSGTDEFKKWLLFSCLDKTIKNQKNQTGKNADYILYHENYGLFIIDSKDMKTYNKDDLDNLYNGQMIETLNFIQNKINEKKLGDEFSKIKKHFIFHCNDNIKKNPDCFQHKPWNVILNEDLQDKQSFQNWCNKINNIDQNTLENFLYNLLNGPAVTGKTQLPLYDKDNNNLGENKYERDFFESIQKIVKESNESKTDEFKKWLPFGFLDTTINNEFTGKSNNKKFKKEKNADFILYHENYGLFIIDSKDMKTYNKDDLDKFYNGEMIETLNFIQKKINNEKNQNLKMKFSKIKKHFIFHCNDNIKKNPDCFQHKPWNVILNEDLQDKQSFQNWCNKMGTNEDNIDHCTVKNFLYNLFDVKIKDLEKDIQDRMMTLNQKIKEEVFKEEKFILNGPAGTGKTLLLQQKIQQQTTFKICFIDINYGLFIVISWPGMLYQDDKFYHEEFDKILNTLNTKASQPLKNNLLNINKYFVFSCGDDNSIHDYKDSGWRVIKYGLNYQNLFNQLLNEFKKTPSQSSKTKIKTDQLEKQLLNFLNTDGKYLLINFSENMSFTYKTINDFIDSRKKVKSILLFRSKENKILSDYILDLKRENKVDIYYFRSKIKDEFKDLQPERLFENYNLYIKDDEKYLVFDSKNDSNLKRNSDRETNFRESFKIIIYSKQFFVKNLIDSNGFLENETNMDIFVDDLMNHTNQKNRESSYKYNKQIIESIIKKVKNFVITKDLEQFKAFGFDDKIKPVFPHVDIQLKCINLNTVMRYSNEIFEFIDIFFKFYQSCFNNEYYQVFDCLECFDTYLTRCVKNNEQIMLNATFYDFFNSIKNKLNNVEFNIPSYTINGRLEMISYNLNTANEVNWGNMLEKKINLKLNELNRLNEDLGKKDKLLVILDGNEVLLDKFDRDKLEVSVVTQNSTVDYDSFKQMIDRTRENKQKIKQFLKTNYENRITLLDMSEPDDYFSYESRILIYIIPGCCCLLRNKKLELNWEESWRLEPYFAVTRGSYDVVIIYNQCSKNKTS